MAGARDLGMTFAGGGNRALFQLGLMRRWWARLQPRVAAVAGVSAGACMLTVLLSKREEQVRTFFAARRGGVSRNLDWTALLRREPIAPHGSIYRDTLLHAYAGGGFERVKRAPFPVLMLAAEIPRPLPRALGTLVGFGAYQLEKQVRPGMVHPTFGRQLGFRPFVFDARACRSAAELADLVLASSATPPFTPMGRFRGRTLIDGGVIDNNPAFVTEQVASVRRNLVVMTRPYPSARTGLQGRRLYIAPSRPPPADCWDYRRDAPVDENLALGERDAAAHEDALARLLDR
ncbi:MAG: patatin-like phospholipase family protein [Myxococcales bacterium]|nr:patatin-like phospholipase family protein [Myxococcales bacterium]